MGFIQRDVPPWKHSAYKPQWFNGLMYDGEITAIEHLQESPHNIRPERLEGYSEELALKLHDWLHDVNRQNFKAKVYSRYFEAGEPVIVADFDIVDSISYHHRHSQTGRFIEYSQFNRLRTHAVVKFGEVIDVLPVELLYRLPDDRVNEVYAALRNPAQPHLPPITFTTEVIISDKDSCRLHKIIDDLLERITGDPKSRNW